MPAGRREYVALGGQARTGCYLIRAERKPADFGADGQRSAAYRCKARAGGNVGGLHGRDRHAIRRDRALRLLLRAECRQFRALRAYPRTESIDRCAQRRDGLLAFCRHVRAGSLHLRTVRRLSRAVCRRARTVGTECRYRQQAAMCYRVSRALCDLLRTRSIAAIRTLSSVQCALCRLLRTDCLIYRAFGPHRRAVRYDFRAPCDQRSAVRAKRCRVVVGIACRRVSRASSSVARAKRRLYRANRWCTGAVRAQRG